jgi:hypothetical protein
LSTAIGRLADEEISWLGLPDAVQELEAPTAVIFAVRQTPPANKNTTGKQKHHRI